MVATILATLVVVSAPSSSQIANAAEYSKSCNGVSFLILHRGKVIAEEYPNGGSANRATELASGTKSFTGVMALAAEEDGLLKMDERASDTLPEWSKDSRKDVTIRQLLSLCSGVPGNKGTRMGQRVPSYADAVQVEATFPVGQRFQYGPTPFMAFGEILRRKLAPKGESVMQYMERRIFKPIGLQHGLWRKDSDGNPHLPSGAHLNAREWAKFGEMVRLDGKGVLRAGATKQLWIGTPANPSYGLSWWMPAKGGVRPDGFRKWPWNAKLPTDIMIAAGAGGQRLYIIPSRELTVIRQAPVKLRDPFEDETFLTKLFLG